MVYEIPFANTKKATIRKLIYEEKKAGGTIQIWEEPDGRYRQVINTGDNISVYDCEKKGNQVKCGSFILDINTKKTYIKPINIEKEVRKKISVIDRILLTADKEVKNVKNYYSNSFDSLLKTAFKWALIGAAAYFAFIYIKKQVDKNE